MKEEEILSELVEDVNNIRILRHMETAKVDYAKNIMRYTEIDKLVVFQYLKKFQEMGLLEIYGNTSIKRTDAKLKKSAEVHKHHTYFKITRLGEIVLKMADCKFYLKMLQGPCLERLQIRRYKNVEPDKDDERIMRMGLIERHGKLTDMGENVMNLAIRRGYLK
ncbi:DUF2250 domain-containing protein [Cuniculiplasma sp. SKW3]|uniref:DUF2250 domain-containing protein n=1 Tax=unclassified Cuniculiplasma TaxID=2619706 RepID=UPI003FD4ED54